MSPSLSQAIESRLRSIPDYPKPAILFRYITPVLGDAQLLKQVIEGLTEPFRKARVTHVDGVEARGFILGGPVAVLLGAGFIPVRKAGKLPWKARRQEYSLE